MKIAILGLGTVGYGVYDIIQTKDYLKDVVVKYVLDKNLELQKVVGENTLVTTDYNKILEDKEVELVVETMGAKNFSYDCIKKALLAGKSIVTANKEVIAEHIDELTSLKNEKKVQLYYEASVGGGIPVIYPLHQASKVNYIANIKGILNGTTNFILTKMSEENYTFEDALKLAQKLGFAEADPTADLEGLDMVRKIAILSSIAYKGTIDLDKVYHYGISNVSKDDIDYIKEAGYGLKLIASSKINNNVVDIRIEPSLVSASSVFSKANYEFNIVSIDCDVNGELMFYGKGAGRYPTANAIINDLIMYMENDNSYSFKNENELVVEEAKENAQYYFRFKDEKDINDDIILSRKANQVITKEISKEEFYKYIDKVNFYGKVIK